MSFTAKVYCYHKSKSGDGVTTLNFCPDYEDDRNKEWAVATPSLSFQMNVKDELADKIDLRSAFTVTFTEFTA